MWIYYCECQLLSVHRGRAHQSIQPALHGALSAAWRPPAVRFRYIREVDRRSGELRAYGLRSLVRCIHLNTLKFGVTMNLSSCARKRESMQLISCAQFAMQTLSA